MSIEVESQIKERKSSTGDTAVRSLSCLCLISDKALIQEWTDYFAAKGCNLICHLADSMSASRAIVARGGISFTFTYFSDPAKAGKTLSPHFPIGSIWFPPLVVTVDRTPSEDELERFRLQGVAYLVERPFILSEDYPILNAILQSKSWVREKSAPLLEILQTCGRLTHPVLITVTSPAGWLGRIYIKEGQVIHAETPKESKVKAVAEMLSIQGGRILVHDVFISPQSPNSSDSIQSTLLAAMEILDESGNWSTASSSSNQSFGNGGAPESVITTDEPIEDEPALEISTVEYNSNARQDSLSHKNELNNIEKELEEALTPPKARSNSTKVQIPRTKPMFKIDEIIKSDPSISGVAIANMDGNITQSVGHIEAEVACAVASLGNSSINDIASLLGMGEVQGWSVVGDKVSLYVKNDNFMMLVGLGSVTKNPEASLKKILQNT